MGSPVFWGELTIRILLVGLSGIFAAWIFRRRAAATQHTLLLFVLGGMLVLPLLSIALPPLRLLPERVVVTLSANSAPPSQASLSQALASAPFHRPILKGPAPVWRRPGWLAWPSLLGIVYSAVLFLLILKLVIRVGKARKIVSAATPIMNGPAHVMLQDSVAKVGLPYPLPRLYESATVGIPFTAGWEQKIILLPDTWPSWDAFKLQAVLAHEIAHIRRHDWLIALAASVSRSLFWYHPLVWWLERRLATLAEEACDASAISLTADAQRYATVVLEFARVVQHQPIWAPTSMAQSSKVGHRIHRILDGHATSNRALARTGWTAMLVTTLGVVYGAAALQLTKQAPLKPLVELHQSVLAEGWHTTPAEAAHLESELARDPHNLSIRTRLISYYYQQMIFEPRMHHTLWLIEYHPEAEVFRVAPDVTDMAPTHWTGGNTQLGYKRGKALWIQHTERSPMNTTILAHAALALSGADSAMKLEFIRRARAAEPDNPEWTAWLARVYALAARSIFAGGNVGASASLRGDDGLPGFGLPLPLSEGLTNELESSIDASLVGATGEALVIETGLLRQFRASAQGLPKREGFDGTDVELAKSAEFGEHLLEKARTLDSENPRWRRALSTRSAP